MTLTVSLTSVLCMTPTKARDFYAKPDLDSTPHLSLSSEPLLILKDSFMRSTSWANRSMLCNLHRDHQAKSTSNDDEEAIATDSANDEGQEKDHDKGIKKNKAEASSSSSSSSSLAAKDR